MKDAFPPLDLSLLKERESESESESESARERERERNREREGLAGIGMGGSSHATQLPNGSQTFHRCNHSVRTILNDY